MGRVKKILTIVTAVTFFGACASKPEKISASYVSPLQYQGYNCNQIQMELMRVNRKIIEITGLQQKEYEKDSAAMGVGLILFWPALFFLIGEDKKGELARLKGEYEALEVAAIEKECDIAAELEEARKQREAYEAERAEKEQKGSECTGGWSAYEATQGCE